MKMERLCLHEILCEILGSKNCYYSPPSNIRMQYPCICYNLSNSETIFADNKSYMISKRYTITLIDEDPDSKIPERLLELPYCTSDRNYSEDGLNHFVFTMFFNGERIKKEEDYYESYDQSAYGWENG